MSNIPQRVVRESATLSMSLSRMMRKSHYCIICSPPGVVMHNSEKNAER
ncbi:hypothetical protein SPAB_04353 [Salmonella enterica subsp. enterica serovar Paratyphi B str. SPB7]|uniref:Uncharacterized protein n=1 Tax=Salmonella paratyphi B (strain ATCC BAA-1250 / SPB7) TaxID=1016998 RepID=A0A6C6Z7Y7_SALPB|nr:hypothetical protein SPAB_04353 [Salmonella enterica subsp. enterica serovar Paratyphi B str. SPB7]